MGFLIFLRSLHFPYFRENDLLYKYYRKSIEQIAILFLFHLIGFANNNFTGKTALGFLSNSFSFR